MHIIITEKDVNGRNMLNRILKMEGHEVSIAESSGHVIDLLKGAGTNVVLMDIFQCMYSSGVELERKLTVRQIDTPKLVLMVTCGGSAEEAGELMSLEKACGDIAFDLLPTKMKSGIMDSIQQICRALRLSSRKSFSGEDFNWRRFTLLMGLPSDAYAGSHLS